jgi:hypothetical protein
MHKSFCKKNTTVRGRNGVMVSCYELAKKFYKAYRMNNFDMMKDTAQITKRYLKEY